MAENIIILFPTAMEADPFTAKYGGLAVAEICGIGLVECAASAARIIMEKKPDFIVLAGIAGAYPGKGLRKGDTVLVTREIPADLGSMTGGEFRHLAGNGSDARENHYDCPTLLPGIFPKVVSNSVNTAATSNLAPESAEAAVENMEGAAFFAVCRSLGVPFAEIRAVSNYVGEGRGKWIIPQAAANLAEGAAALLDFINHGKSMFKNDTDVIL